MPIKRRFAVSALATTLAATALIAAAAPAGSAAPLGTSSDFNGDGYLDQVVSAPNATVSGHKAAGYVAVVYGSANGLNTAKRQIIHQDTNGVPGAPEAGDRFGYATAAGDHNGDGYADLVISAPGEDLGSYRNAGMATLLLGGENGVGSASVDFAGDSSDTLVGASVATGDLNRDGYADFVYGGGKLFTYSLGRADEPAVAAAQVPAVRQRQVSVAASLRSSVAAGDINGDGYDDVVWNIHGYTSPWVGYGSPQAVQRLSGDGIVCLPGSRDVAIADVNGDGYGDVIVGRPYYSGVAGGGISVRPGTSGGLSKTRYYTVGQNTSGVPGAGETGDGFGASIAARDLSGDERAEIAVGIPGENGSSGAVTLLRGSATWSLGSGARVFHQNTYGVPGYSEAGDRFGRAVAFNDHNGDGRPDLITGVPGENGWNGALVVLKGANGTITTSGAQAFGPGSVGGLGTAGWFAAALVR